MKLRTKYQLKALMRPWLWSWVVETDQEFDEWLWAALERNATITRGRGRGRGNKVPDAPWDLDGYVTLDGVPLNTSCIDAGAVWLSSRDDKHGIQRLASPSAALLLRDRIDRSVPKFDPPQLGGQV